MCTDIMKPTKLIAGYFLILSSLFAGQLSGRMTNSDLQPLAGVNIWSQQGEWGTISDPSGHYSIESVSDGEYLIEITRIGFKSQSLIVMINGRTHLDIQMEPQVIRLSEVTVSGTLALSDATPVTFSTIDENQVVATSHQVDIPQVLSSLPGVYTTSNGGLGIGDSRLMIRGFDEKRLLVLVNNIPVNHPETKEVDWSYWGMLTGSIQAIQVQRGVGTSLYGSGALGGLINIITKDSPAEGSLTANLMVGQYGLKRVGVDYHSGILAGKFAWTSKIHFVESLGWRDNSIYRGLHYYLSLRWLPSPKQTFKLILHGAPNLRTYSDGSASMALYADKSENHYSYGRRFNSNVHIPETDLSTSQSNSAVSLTDAFLMNASLDESPADQASGWIVAGDRASLNNQASHRPQLELHHNWRINPNDKLTTSAFTSFGTDWQDYVYPKWFMHRDNSTGSYNLEQIASSGAVFEYRDVHSSKQVGLLSAWEREFDKHQISLGFESRYWSARHGGQVFNIFGSQQVSVPVATVYHAMKTGDLFYDFTTTKPQVTIFGHGLRQVGPFSIMVNLQYTAMQFRVVENVPSNKNYPNLFDPSAINSHGGNTWSMTGTIDHDNDSTTTEVLAEYTLWDYTRSFTYLTPRAGINYTWWTLNFYLNQSWGVKEPEIKHFFGFGAPREDISLERTVNTELGLRWKEQIYNIALKMDLTAYRIRFAGKLMELTIPEKANQPGYDYAGHTYVAVGDARYQGLECVVDLQMGKNWQISMASSLIDNTWGEPEYSEGAQRLYSNVAVANVDYNDLDDDGHWDEGQTETALHSNFVEKYGRRHDVGMPGLLLNGRLERRWHQFGAAVAARYHNNIYVLEDNSEILVGSGKDDLFYTADDQYSPTLSEAWLVDLLLNYNITLGKHTLTVNLKVHNIFDTIWWQRGDENGVLPGAPRTVLLALNIK